MTSSLPLLMANQAALRLSVWSPFSRIARTSASVRSTRYFAMIFLTTGARRTRRHRLASGEKAFRSERTARAGLQCLIRRWNM